MGDLTRKVDDLVGTVSGARALPLSASCVLNRVDLLAALEELRGLLVAEFATADEVIAGRDEILAAARGQAEQILVAAGRERARILSETDLVREARDEADRLLAAARESAGAMRREIDDYVDGKLATFEVVLARTTASVARGRSRLAGRTGYSQLGEAGPRPGPNGTVDGERPPGAGHVLVDPSDGLEGLPDVRVVPAEPPAAEPPAEDALFPAPRPAGDPGAGRQAGRGTAVAGPGARSGSGAPSAKLGRPAP